MSACEHGWASENYVKCPRCYDKARHAEEVARLTSDLAESEARRVEAEREVERLARAIHLFTENMDHVAGKANALSFALLQRAESAERSLAAAVEVLRGLTRAAQSVLETTHPVPLPTADGLGWEPLVAKDKYVNGLKDAVAEAASVLGGGR